MSVRSGLGGWGGERDGVGGCCSDSARDFAHVCSLLASCDEWETFEACRPEGTAQQAFWSCDSGGAHSLSSLESDDAATGEGPVPCMARELERAIEETEVLQRRQEVCDSHSDPSEHLLTGFPSCALVSSCSSKSLHSYALEAAKRPPPQMLQAAEHISCKRARPSPPPAMAQPLPPPPPPQEIGGVTLQEALHNAAAVEQVNRPEFSGNWRGCKKSAWCDREFSHRGMCNKKAKVLGLAAWSQAEVEAARGSSAHLADAQELGEACYGGPGVTRPPHLIERDSDQGSATNLEAFAGQVPSLGVGDPSLLVPSGEGGDGEVTGHLRLLHSGPPVHTGDTTSFSSDDVGIDSDSDSEATVDDYYAPAGPHPPLPLHPSTLCRADPSGAAAAGHSFPQVLQSVVAPLPPHNEDLNRNHVAPAPPRTAGDGPVEVPLRVVSGGKVKPGGGFVPHLLPLRAPQTTAAKTNCPAGSGGRPPNTAPPLGHRPPPAKQPAAVPLPAGLVTRKGAARNAKANEKAPQLQQPLPPPPLPPAHRPAANSVPPGQACTQCFAQATPVWRAGPMGPKTLCNACGVRWTKDNKRRVRS